MKFDLLEDRVSSLSRKCPLAATCIRILNGLEGFENNIMILDGHII